MTTDRAPRPVGIYRLGRAYQEVMATYARTWRQVTATVHAAYLVQLSRSELRAHRRRCRRCPNLPGYPRPLRVNGAEYDRRRRARKRRNRA